MAARKASAFRRVERIAKVVDLSGYENVSFKTTPRETVVVDLWDEE